MFQTWGFYLVNRILCMVILTHALLLIILLKLRLISPPARCIIGVDLPNS